MTKNLERPSNLWPPDDERSKHLSWHECGNLKPTEGIVTLWCPCCEVKDEGKECRLEIIYGNVKINLFSRGKIMFVSNGRWLALTPEKYEHLSTQYQREYLSSSDN